RLLAVVLAVAACRHGRGDQQQGRRRQPRLPAGNGHDSYSLRIPHVLACFLGGNFQSLAMRFAEQLLGCSGVSRDCRGGRPGGGVTSTPRCAGSADRRAVLQVIEVAVAGGSAMMEDEDHPSRFLYDPGGGVSMPQRRDWCQQVPEGARKDLRSRWTTKR